jgi:hypothetical protein
MEDVISEIILIILLLFFFQELIRSISDNKKRLKYIKSASCLSRSVLPGRYVKFTGILSYPQTQTPYHGVSCAYWRMDIRGLFKRKQKKPGKGWVEYSPVIYNESMQDKPILMHNGNDVVHVEFHPDTHVMRGMKSKQTIQKECPENISTKMCRSKYSQYKIIESWYPVHQQLTVIGRLAAVDNCTFTISESHQQTQPPMMVVGTIKALLEQHTRSALFSSIILIFTTVAYLFCTFVLQASGLSWVINLILGLIIVVIWFLVYDKGIILEHKK